MNIPSSVYLSVVVPFYNEEDVVELFHEKLLKSVSSLKKTCEIIYIDDGSEDETLEILKRLVASCPIPIKLLEFRRNFGQTACLQAGFDHAQGDIIITMDGDLQHDPAEISHFIDKIEEGYDLVSGWRKKRVDSFIMRRLPSMIANKMMARFSGIKLRDFGTTYKAYRRELAKKINLYGELHRFIPVLAAQYGAKIYELSITNSVRLAGKSKYGLSRASKVFFDILTLAFFLSYSTRPMHFWGRLGLLSFVSGLGLLFYTIISYFIFGHDLRGTMQIAIMGIILGIQLFAMGLILEFLLRIRYEATEKKIYSVRQIHQK